jgi:hydrogenase nickel incorporation protein HypA/HybF
MHELGITRNIVAIVSEHAGARRVRRVALEIGALSAVVPDAIRFCFEICCQGTVLEGAALEIREVQGRARCKLCGAQRDFDGLSCGCACGSVQMECIAGEELRIKEMETY